MSHSDELAIRFALVFCAVVGTEFLLQYGITRGEKSIGILLASALMSIFVLWAVTVMLRTYLLTNYRRVRLLDRFVACGFSTYLCTGAFDVRFFLLYFVTYFVFVVVVPNRLLDDEVSLRLDQNFKEFGIDTTSPFPISYLFVALGMIGLLCVAWVKKLI